MATKTVKWKINVARNQRLLLTEAFVFQRHYAVLQWAEGMVLGSFPSPARQEPCSPAGGTGWEPVWAHPPSVDPSLAAQSLWEGLQQTTTNIGGPHELSLGPQMVQVKGNHGDKVQV